MHFDFDQDLLAYFTDVEYLRAAFEASVARTTLTKRLLVIHGVGGVGKSSLLRMFRLHCKRAHVPVALASGDEAKSALDVLVRWVDDLKAGGVAWPSFDKTFAHYRDIQAKVDTEAQKTRSKMADLAGKAAGKTAETVAAATVGAALGSVIPGIGTVAGALGGMGAEALVDWLRGFLKQTDIDLLLDPARKITDDFINDIAPAANKQRIVLMLDTFEQMTTLDDWVRSIAQRLPANVLFVIAGRGLPDWSRTWPTWMANAHVEELKPMTDDDMRELVRRYYATMRGGVPNPVQVEAIIHFARGLPMVVTSAVQLWVKYGVEDFQTVKPEIVAALVDRLMEGVPPELIPVLEGAGSVRWFDQPILRAVTGLADVREAYNELRRFPFVRTRVEGLALHDAVREIVDENLRTQDAERHYELHKRAAAYFEDRIEKAAGKEIAHLALERLYHRVRADEEAGIALFQEMAEEFVRYWLVSRLRTLLNDVNTYPLEYKNSQLWREYYNARLAQLEVRWADAEKVYQAIGENESADPKLRAYALCDLAGVLTVDWYVGQVEGAERAAQILQQSLELSVLDSHLAQGFVWLGRIARYRGEWDKQIDYVGKAKSYFEQQGDSYGVVRMYSELKRTHARRGNWQAFFNTDKQERDVVLRIPKEALALKADLLGKWVWTWALAGRYAECEARARESLAIGRSLGNDLRLIAVLRDLGWALGVQGKLKEADECFNESLMIARQYGSGTTMDQGATLGFWGAILIRAGNLDLAKDYLLRSQTIKESLHAIPGTIESLNWLGLCSEIQGKWENASDYYQARATWKWYGANYFQCTALTGLVRVKHAQEDYAAIPALLAEAEQLAQQYEYNDHLASLRLTRAQTCEVLEHAASLTPLDYFRQAMVYALRYNRFLLDEVLSGRVQGSPLRPIIPYCRTRGTEGRQILIELRDWWKTGSNDIVASRPDTISPIPEGITLLEAERIAREREPGDGTAQKSVVEQIEAAL